MSGGDGGPNATGPFDGASPLRSLALVVRFFLELALLAGVAVLAWRLVPGWWHWPAAIVGVVAVATLWGYFLSPKARVALPKAAKLVIEAALFIGVGAGLYALGLGTAAIAGVAIWVLDRVALALTRN